MQLQHHSAARALGTRLRELRERRGLTARELAAQAELHGSHVTRIERGAANPALSTLVSIADVLGTSVADLVRDIR